MNPTPGTQNPVPSTRPIRPNGEFRPNGEARPTGEVPVYCDCCPHRPKKMAVIQPDAIQIISRRSGRKHIVRIPLHNPRSRSRETAGPVLDTGAGVRM